MAANEEFIDSTIASLKIIGMVPKSGKLALRKGQLALDIPDKSQSLRRWVNGDSRDITMMHLRNTINSAIKICKSLLTATNLELAAWTLSRMINEMENCETGLQNLKTTYANDSMMTANLDVLADRLKAHKNEFIALGSAKPDLHGHHKKYDKGTDTYSSNCKGTDTNSNSNSSPYNSNTTTTTTSTNSNPKK